MRRRRFRTKVHGETRNPCVRTSSARLHSRSSVIEFRHYLLFRAFRAVFLDKVICSFIPCGALLAAEPVFPLRFPSLARQNLLAVASFPARYYARPWIRDDFLIPRNKGGNDNAPSRTFNHSQQLWTAFALFGELFVCTSNIIMFSSAPSHPRKKCLSGNDGCYSPSIWKFRL